jgi:hypothetical protein
LQLLRLCFAAGAQYIAQLCFAQGKQGRAAGGRQQATGLLAQRGLQGGFIPVFQQFGDISRDKARALFVLNTRSGLR